MATRETLWAVARWKSGLLYSVIMGMADLDHGLLRSLLMYT